MQDYHFQLFNKLYFYHRWAKTMAGIFTISVWQVKHKSWSEDFPGFPAISIWGGKND